MCRASGVGRWCDGAGASLADCPGDTGIAISVVWSMLATAVLLKLIDATLGLRVGVDEELLVLAPFPPSFLSFLSLLSLAWPGILGLGLPAYCHACSRLHCGPGCMLKCSNAVLVDVCMTSGTYLQGLDMVCHGETVFPQNLGIEWQGDGANDASNKSGTVGTRHSGPYGNSDTVWMRIVCLAMI